jgi:hypothetical protein
VSTPKFSVIERKVVGRVKENRDWPKTKYKWKKKRKLGCWR